MTIEYQVDESTHLMEILVSGHFNFHLSDDFHQLVKTPSKVDKIVIDLEKTVSIDSAGLGILFFLRKQLLGLKLTNKRIVVFYLHC